MLTAYILQLHSLDACLSICRELVLDCEPVEDCSMMPQDLQLNNLTQLTRLELKGHSNHFGTSNYEDDEGPSDGASHKAQAA